MPQQRRLTEDERREAATLLGLKGNKKMIQERLTQKTGKVILLKDLSNVSGEVNRGSTRNDLEKVVTTLTETYGESHRSLQYSYAYKNNKLPYSLTFYII